MLNVVAMAPVVLECPNAECALGADGAKYEIQKLEPDIAIRLLDHHIQQNHAGPVRAGDVPQPVRSEIIQRPKLVIKEGFTTDEAFNYFEHAWGKYKVLASITTAAVD